MKKDQKLGFMNYLYRITKWSFFLTPDRTQIFLYINELSLQDGRFF